MILNSLYSKLTIFTFLWHQDEWNRSYGTEHVIALERQLRKYLHIPFEFVCVTNDRIEGITTYPLWPEPVQVAKGRPSCFRRLKLFDAEFGELWNQYSACVDLDTLIVDDITSLFWPVIYGPDSHRFNSGVVCPINGSMWVVQNGQFDWLWKLFIDDPVSGYRKTLAAKWADGRKYYGSDQAWMSLMLHPVHPKYLWWETDGVYSWRPGITKKGRPYAIPKAAKIVFFQGGLKPWSEGMKDLEKGCPEIWQKYQEFL